MVYYDHSHNRGHKLRGRNMPSRSKSKLKAHMLRVFREIEETGEEWVVADHNLPVLHINPIVTMPRLLRWRHGSRRRFAPGPTGSGASRTLRCVDRAGPNTRQARRSETRPGPHRSLTHTTARLLFAGLRSFPKKLPSGSGCPATNPPPASSMTCPHELCQYLN